MRGFLESKPKTGGAVLLHGRRFVTAKQDGILVQLMLFLSRRRPRLCAIRIEMLFRASDDSCATPSASRVRVRVAKWRCIHMCNHCVVRLELTVPVWIKESAWKVTYAAQTGQAPFEAVAGFQGRGPRARSLFQARRQASQRRFPRPALVSFPRQNILLQSPSSTTVTNIPILSDETPRANMSSNMSSQTDVEMQYKPAEPMQARQGEPSETVRRPGRWARKLGCRSQTMAAIDEGAD